MRTKLNQPLPYVPDERAAAQCDARMCEECGELWRSLDDACQCGHGVSEPADRDAIATWAEATFAALAAEYGPSLVHVVVGHEVNMRVMCEHCPDGTALDTILLQFDAACRAHDLDVPFVVFESGPDPLACDPVSIQSAGMVNVVPKAGALPATWPGSDPLDRNPEKSMDAAFPSVNVARKTEPLPLVTVTPLAEPVAGELARRVRDNLARLESDVRLPEVLRSVVRNTLEMAELAVEHIELAQAPLSFREFTPEEATEVRAQLDQANRGPVRPTIKPWTPQPDAGPTFCESHLDALAQSIAVKVTQKLAAEPLMRLLDAAREWVACPADADQLDELGGVLVDRVEACAGIEPRKAGGQ